MSLTPSQTTSSDATATPYPTIRALFEATDEAGNPDWLQRLGVELALGSLAGESGGTGALLPGVTVVYRLPR